MASTTSLGVSVSLESVVVARFPPFRLRLPMLFLVVFVPVTFFPFSFLQAFLTLFWSINNTDGGVKGVRKPQNRTEIRQKTANRIGFFPEYRNRAYREAHYMKADVTKTWVSFAAFANIFISAVATETINIRAKLNPLSGKVTSMTCSPHETQKERKLTSSS